MTTILVIVAAGVGLLSAVAKLAAVLGRAREPARRSLWLGIAILGLAMAGHLPPVYQSINTAAGVNAHWPIVFTAIVSAMYFFQLFFIHSIYADAPTLVQRRTRRGLRLVLLTSLAMLVPFLLRPDATDFTFGPSGRYVAGGPGDKVAEIAGLVLATYLIIAGVTLTSLATRWANRADPGGLRAGLRVLAFGSALGTLVALHSAGYLLTLMAGIVPAWPEATVSAWLVPIVCVLQLVGVVLPAAWARVARWLEYRHALTALYPLWARMVAAAPTVLKRPVRPRWFDRLRVTGLYSALYRRWVELSDVRSVLRKFTPAGHEQRLRELGRGHGLTSDQLDAVVEAALIDSGIQHLQDGHKPLSPAQVTIPPQSRSDVMAEVAHWCAVATAAHSPTYAQLRADLRSASSRSAH